MATSIKLKKSSIAGRIPSTSDLAYGELAINYADGVIYYKNSSNSIQSINAAASGVDSAAVTNLIDTDYIRARAVTNYAFDFGTFSAGVGFTLDLGSI